MYRVYRQGWMEERHYIIYLSYTTHYIILIPAPRLISTRNLLPISCSIAFNALDLLNPLFLVAWDASIRHLSPSLFERISQDLSKGKSKEDMSYTGEGKVLPLFMQSGFERNKGFLYIDSYNRAGYSINEDLSKRHGELMKLEEGGKCSLDEGLIHRGEYRKRRKEGLAYLEHFFLTSL